VKEPKELVLRGSLSSWFKLAGGKDRADQLEGRNGLFLGGNGKQNGSPLEQKWESQVTSIGLSE
jgi:hypothetical protein